MRVESQKRKIMMNGEILVMEKMNGLVTCKNESMKGETSERALQGKKVTESLQRIMIGKTVSREVKKVHFRIA